MAFLKPIEMRETGITAAYWRLTHVQVDCVARVLDAQLHGYRDEAARRAGLSPVHRFAFRFATKAFQDPAVVAMADIYAAIREAPGAPDAQGEAGAPLFADATDI